MEDLTDRQKAVLEYIVDFMYNNGTWPSFRDIQSNFGFKSTNAVMGHLRALESKGCITRVPGQARTFRIEPSVLEQYLPNGAEPVVEVPIYGAIAAGYPDGVEPGGAIGRLQVDAETAGLRRNTKTFALKVRGESMIDAGIDDGDIVIIEQGQPNNGDIVAALIDGETTLKRFMRKRGRGPFLKAENKNYPELYPVAELVIQGIAKAVVRSLN